MEQQQCESRVRSWGAQRVTLHNQLPTLFLHCFHIHHPDDNEYNYLFHQFTILKEPYHAGILVDDQTVLGWLMSHLDAAEIEEVSQGVLGRLIRDSRNLVVIFCKYMAYAIIALTHTCYLIKNYSPDELNKFLPLKNVKGMASET